MDATTFVGDILRDAEAYTSQWVSGDWQEASVKQYRSHMKTLNCGTLKHRLNKLGRNQMKSLCLLWWIS